MPDVTEPSFERVGDDCAKLDEYVTPLETLETLDILNDGVKIEPPVGVVLLRSEVDTRNVATEEDSAELTVVDVDPSRLELGVET